MPAPKILVVEDFEQSRRFIVSTLQQRAEFQITEALDGLQAFQKVKEQHSDLVLLDVGIQNLIVPPKSSFSARSLPLRSSEKLSALARWATFTSCVPVVT